MRRFSIWILVLSVSLWVSCKPKPREVSSVERAQALQLASDAQISAQLRDYAKAVEALSRATQLDPEVPAYWSGLGVNRMRQGDKSGARKAYEKAVSIYEDLAKKDPKDAVPLLKQIEALVLLGRVEDARKVLQRALREFPRDPTVRAFNDAKFIDQMLKDPSMKAVML